MQLKISCKQVRLMNVLEYKGYHAVVEYDVLDKMLYGRVEGVNDPIQFESTSSKNIEKEFRKAVDEYLDFCMTTGKEPEKEYTGSFNVRIGKKLHKELALQALKSQISLNAAVIEAIEMYLEHSL